MERLRKGWSNQQQAGCTGAEDDEEDGSRPGTMRGTCQDHQQRGGRQGLGASRKAFGANYKEEDRPGHLGTQEDEDRLGWEMMRSMVQG